MPMFLVDVFYAASGDGADEWEGEEVVEATDAAAAAAAVSIMPDYLDCGRGYSARPIVVCPGCNRAVQEVDIAFNVRRSWHGRISVRIEHGAVEVLPSWTSDEGEDALDDNNTTVACDHCGCDLTLLLRHLIHNEEEWSPLVLAETV